MELLYYKWKFINISQNKKYQNKSKDKVPSLQILPKNVHLNIKAEFLPVKTNLEQHPKK